MIGTNTSIGNSGYNSGAMVGINNGRITLNQVKTIPSLISELVMALGDVCMQDIPSVSDGMQTEFKPDEKIKYNKVIKYREIIKEYSAYYSTCEEYMNMYDDSNIRGKAKILRCINLWYKKAKGELLQQYANTGKSELDIVQENSDALIDMVQSNIYEAVCESPNIKSREDMELGIACFVCYCFMECKILEKPE